VVSLSIRFALPPFSLNSGYVSGGGVVLWAEPRRNLRQEHFSMMPRRLLRWMWRVRWHFLTVTGPAGSPALLWKRKRGNPANLLERTEKPA
jgi:hypothetical protein